MPKPIKWTPDMITHFWGGVAFSGAMQKLSFGRLAGPQLLLLVQSYLNKGMRCLDYGSGDGDFAQLLIKAGYSVAAFETNPARSKNLVHLLKTEPLFLGSVDETNSDHFDTAFCLEVIEHVPDDQLGAFLVDLNRRLTEGGHLILTCPNSEDLDLDEVYCPACDSRFHRWQHLRSIGAGNLRQLLEAAGFETIWQALIGFTNLGALTRLSRVGADRWPFKMDDEHGYSLTVVQPGDRILYIGRKARGVDAIPKLMLQRFVASSRADGEQRGLEQPHLKKSALMAVARQFYRMQTATNVVAIAPRQNNGSFAIHKVQKRTTSSITKEELRENMTAIFGGSLNAYASAVAAGTLPEFAKSYIFDGGDWRSARALPANTITKPQIAEPVSASSRFVAALERHLRAREIDARRLALRLAEKSWARRMQPFFDHREKSLAQLLGSSWQNFPYRMRRAVEGRVVIAISSLFNGGAERQAVYLARGLKEHGISDVHLLAEHLGPEGNDFYLEEAKRFCADVVDLPDEPNGEAAWLNERPELVGVVHGYLSNRILNAAEYLQKLSPEVVHASLDWTNVTVGLAAALAGVPSIILSGRNLGPHHFRFFNWFMYPCYRALLHQANIRLVTNSEAGARDYAEWLRIPTEEISVIRNGIDDAFFEPAAPSQRSQARRYFRIPENSKVIASAFRFSEEKRPLTWVEAAAEIYRQDPETFFLACGVGPLLGQAKQLAWSCGIGERCLFMGATAEMLRVYAASDMVMLASSEEGTPNVLIEAQSMGIPVVATPALGTLEAVEQGVTGIISASMDAVALSSAALSVLQDDHFREQARKAGPEYIKKRFGLTRMVDDTLALYKAMGYSSVLSSDSALASLSTRKVRR